MKTFETFFRDNAKNIGIVLYAEGCREGWIQGEMYRQSTDENFMVNSYKLKNHRGTVDLCGEQPAGSDTKQPMVAEIKIIAPSFLQKNIDGNHNIDKYLQNNVIKINNESLAGVNLKEGSLLKDVVRLKSIDDNEGLERYMILIIPEYEEETVNPKLKTVLENIELSDCVSHLTFVEDHHFQVKIWKL